MEPLKPETVLPQFAPLPYFLFDIEVNGKPLTYLAMIVYALLRNKANQSQDNGYYDDNRNVYVFYPVEKLAEEVHRDRGRVQDALKLLETAKLIHREHIGFQSASRIYIYQVPDDAKSPHLTCCENATLDDVKTPHLMEQKRHSNKMINKENKVKSTDATASTFKKFIPPSLEEAKAYFAEKGSTDIEAENFMDYYDSNGWMVGKNKMKAWKSAASRWIRQRMEWSQQKNPAKPAEKEYKDL